MSVRRLARISLVTTLGVALLAVLLVSSGSSEAIGVQLVTYYVDTVQGHCSESQLPHWPRPRDLHTASDRQGQ